MSTSQDQQHVHYSNGIDHNDINKNTNQANSFRSQINDPARHQSSKSEHDQMDLDQLHVHSDTSYHNSPNGSKELLSNVGQKFRPDIDYGVTADNSYLDSLLPPQTCEYGSTFNSASPNQILNNYIYGGGPSKLSDQDFYGFQPQSQPSPGYGQSSIFGDTAPSSSYDSSSTRGSAASSEYGPNLHVDFSAFHDQMRQYQQAAMASRSSDQSMAPYFEQPACSQQPAQSTSVQNLSLPLHKQSRPKRFPDDSSLLLRQEYPDSSEADRQWLLNRLELASQKVGATPGGHNPATSHFARHHVNFSRALWDASDVSREPGIIAEQRQVGLAMPPVDIPAGDQHFLYHSSSLSPSSQRYQGYPAIPLSHPHSHHTSASEGERPSSAPLDTQQTFTGSASTDTQHGTNGATSMPARESGVPAHHDYAYSSNHQQNIPPPLAYRERSASSRSNHTDTSESVRSVPSDWSHASRRHKSRKVAPIKIPAHPNDDNDMDSARASWSSSGSAAAKHMSDRFNAPSPNMETPPLSPRRKDYTASISGHSVVQSETGKRLYECRICSRKFPRPSALVVHERIHSGEKPFVCEVCDRPFTVASNLRRHQKIHVKQIKHGGAQAQMAESIGPSTVKAKSRRAKPYPSSSGHQTDSHDSDVSGDLEDDHSNGSSGGSVGSLASLGITSTSGPSHGLPNLDNITHWSQAVGSHSDHL